jgi:Second Messenger Oligonucleotide or Dinucleotide Synthetase domain
MGGGGGGSSTFRRHSPDTLREAVRKAEDESSVKQFEVKLGGTLTELLGAYNSRDAEAVKDRLDAIRAALQGEIEGTFDSLFGGSVAKHTYVDGLSDIDSLILLNDSALENHSPQRALEKMAAIVGAALPGTATVTHGRMAVTVDYGDGMIVQLLPAIKGADGHVHVPSSRRDAWSEINPMAFREALSKRNAECGNKLVPTIKLAKAIHGELPEGQRLSGYHIESLAIAAFRGYTGEKSTSAMLPALFERARDLVLSPIKDSTGQSLHVDSYLGPANSPERLASSHLLGRLARRMRNATAAASVPQWRALFGLEP